MTAGSVDCHAPTLVLGLGNLLLEDDGAGLRLLEELRHDPRHGEEIEFVDGGSQGLALLGYLEGRASVLVLDAVQLGAAPGTVHVLDGRDLQAAHASTAHESGALELLELARLVGQAPENLVVVGIEPEAMHTGIGLSEAVEAALPEALARARKILEEQSAADERR